MNPDALRQALAALPEAATLTLSVAELREALGVEDGPRLSLHGNGARGEQLLTADEVAARLGVSPRWVYDHAHQLGGKRLSRRCVRFPAAGVRRYLERRR